MSPPPPPEDDLPGATADADLDLPDAVEVELEFTGVGPSPAQRAKASGAHVALAAEEKTPPIGRPVTLTNVPAQRAQASGAHVALAAEEKTPPTGRPATLTEVAALLGPASDALEEFGPGVRPPPMRAPTVGPGVATVRAGSAPGARASVDGERKPLARSGGRAALPRAGEPSQRGGEAGSKEAREDAAPVAGAAASGPDDDEDESTAAMTSPHAWEAPPAAPSPARVRTGSRAPVKAPGAPAEREPRPAEREPGQARPSRPRPEGAPGTPPTGRRPIRPTTDPASPTEGAAAARPPRRSGPKRPEAEVPATAPRSVGMSRRPVKPWVPKDAPEEKDEEPEDDVFDAPPAIDPEEEAERLARANRRKRGAVMALVLAAVLTGGALLLNATLGSSPPVTAELARPPLSETLSETWVAKRLQEQHDQAVATQDALTPNGPSAIRPIDSATIAAGAARANGRDGDPRSAPPPGVEPPSVRSADPRGSASPSPTAVSSGETAKAAKAQPDRSGATRTADPSPGVTPKPGTTSRPASGTSTVAPSAKPTSATSAQGAKTQVSSIAPKGSTPRAAKPASGEADDGEAEEPAEWQGIPDELAPGEQPQVIALSEITVDPSAEAPAPIAKAPSRPWPSPKGQPPASGGTGTLSLVSLPRASVSLNGIALGSTPIHGRELPSGRLRLILIGSDDIARVLVIDLAPDENVELSLPLSRLWPESLAPK